MSSGREQRFQTLFQSSALVPDKTSTAMATLSDKFGNGWIVKPISLASAPILTARTAPGQKFTSARTCDACSAQPICFGSEDPFRQAVRTVQRQKPARGRPREYGLATGSHFGSNFAFVHRLDGHEAHGRAHGRLRDSLRVGAIIHQTLDERTYIGRGDEPHYVAMAMCNTVPEMQFSTRFLDHNPGTLFRQKHGQPRA